MRSVTRRLIDDECLPCDELSKLSVFMKKAVTFVRICNQRQFVYSQFSTEAKVISLKGLTGGYDIDIGISCIFGERNGKSMLLQSIRSCVQTAVNTGLSRCLTSCTLPFIDEIIYQQFDNSNTVLRDIEIADDIVSKLEKFSESNRKAFIVLDDVFSSVSDSEFVLLSCGLARAVKDFGHLLLMSACSRRRISLRDLECFREEGIDVSSITESRKLVHDVDPLVLLVSDDQDVVNGMMTRVRGNEKLSAFVDRYCKVRSDRV